MRKFFAGFLVGLALVAGLASAQVTLGSDGYTVQQQRPGAVYSLLSAATTVAAGTTYPGVNVDKTYQADGTTTAGAGAATIVVQCSNDGGTNWVTVGTITLTLATTTSADSFTSRDRCNRLRGNVTAISGTGASVNLKMGY